MEVAATSVSQLETYNQYHRHRREWSVEEARSEREFKAAFHQDWLRQPLELPDLPPSVLSRTENSRLGGSQRTAPKQPTSAEAPITEVSAWVGSTSERRLPYHVIKWTPQPRQGRTKFLDRFNNLG